MSEQKPAPYQPKNSHLATYLSATGAVVAVTAFLPVIIVVGGVAAIVASTRADGRALMGRIGKQTKDLSLDFVHFAAKDLGNVRDALDDIFSKDKKPTAAAIERPAAPLPVPSAPVFNSQSPRAAETAPAAPAAQPPHQRLDVTG